MSIDSPSEEVSISAMVKLNGKVSNKAGKVSSKAKEVKREEEVGMRGSWDERKLDCYRLL